VICFVHLIGSGRVGRSVGYVGWLVGLVRTKYFESVFMQATVLLT
jgi:hypothetical protein